MIGDIPLEEIAFTVGKITISIFMIIHILAMVVLVRQAALATRIVMSDGNKRVLLFCYLHVILLILVLIVIILLPEI